MEEQRHEQKKDIALRIKILHIIFILLVVYFLFHIVVLIFGDDKLEKDFEKLRDNFFLVPQKELAHRGTIYSRNGDVLATSITRTTVRIDFGCDRFRRMGQKAYNEEAAILAQTLADCLGDKGVDEYYKVLIDNNRKFIKYDSKVVPRERRKWLFMKETIYDTVLTTTVNKGARNLRIFRDVDANEWAIIKKVPLLSKGQTYTTEERDYRVYPHGNLALRTIGRLEHHRAYGVESAYRDTLAGRDGRQLTQRITNQFKTRVPDKNNIEAQNGYDVVTTLDVNVQDVADNALREQLLGENAEWGTSIVMECSTGDILAMANLKREGQECVEVQNYAIGIPVNPGSTFKLISAMALLEHGVPTSQKYHSGLGATVAVGGAQTNARVTDSHRIGESTGGVLDMRTAFAESANVYFTRAVYEKFKSNPILFSDFCKGLLIDKKIGLEKFGAQCKPLHSLDHKHPSKYNALVNMAYGYGLEVTPLHTIAIYNAVANNGKMVAPRLILRTERDGKVVSEAETIVLKEQICSKRTLDTLRSFLEDVSKVGTAKEYFGEKVCPFSSGSKTGTAQVESVINGQVYRKGDGYYYGSMVTYFPADKPRYTIMTAIFTKRQAGKKYYGAGLTGPVQKRIATYLYNRDLNYAKEVTTQTHSFATEIKDGNIEKMRAVADEYGAPMTSNSKSGWGKSESAKDGKSLTVSPMGITERTVPNVVGMGLDDALFLLENCGLTVEVIGQGRVEKQSITPKSAVNKVGQKITITLK